MRIPISARDRRAISLGIAVIGGVVLVGRGIPALRRLEGELHVRSAAAAQRADAVERERDALRTALRDAATRGSAEDRRLLTFAFEASNATELGASVAQYAAGVVRGTGGEVHSLTPTPGSAFADGIAPVEIRLTVSTDAVGLFSLIDQLARAPRLTVVRRLSVSHGDPSGAVDRPEELRVDLALAALGRERPAGAPR